MKAPSRQEKYQVSEDRPLSRFKNLIRKTYVIVALLGFTTVKLSAEGTCGKPDPDFRYVSLFVNDQKTQLLQINVQLTQEKPSQTISLTSMGKDHKTHSCMISLKSGWGLHENGCLLNPLWTGMYDTSYWFVFPIKAKQEKEIEFYTDPTKRDTSRIIEEHSENVWIHALPMESSPFRGMVVMEDDNTSTIDLWEKPEGKSKVISSCRVGATDHADYLMLTGLSEGDWLQAQCDIGRCSTDLSPLQCQQSDEEPDKSQGKKISQPPCPIGWVRWRSAPDKVLLRINHSVDTFCCND